MTSNITVNTQNSILIAAEKILLFDPIALPSAVHDADIVFLTHDHYDHFSPRISLKQQMTARCLLLLQVWLLL